METLRKGFGRLLGDKRDQPGLHTGRALHESWSVYMGQGCSRGSGSAISLKYFRSSLDADNVFAVFAVFLAVSAVFAAVAALLDASAFG